MKDTRAASRPRRRSIFRARRTPARADALVWTQDLSGRCARATAVGSHRLLVENHTGIALLTEACIRLNTGCGPITVTGRGLTLCDARRGAAIIRGDICRVDLPPEGGDVGE